LSRVTQSQIVLLANGRVIASTLPGRDLQAQFARLFGELSAAPSQRDAPKEVPLAGEHYFCSAGKFDSLSGDAKLGYLLLSSYEQAWRALQSAQQMLVLVSSLGTCPGRAIVWFLFRKPSQPLRALTPGPEPVGRGDFPKRVRVPSGDES